MKEIKEEKVSKFSERLATARELSNLTQSDLAHALNVTRESINAWENNISKPSIGRIMELSHVLKIGIDYLVGNDNILTVDISSLSSPQQKAIYQLITLFQDETNLKAEIEEELKNYNIDKDINKI